jgi:hypothetical protein
MLEWFHKNHRDLKDNATGYMLDREEIVNPKNEISNSKNRWCLLFANNPG